MPKKEVSFLDYGPVEGCDIDCHNCTRKCGGKAYSSQSSGESGWRDFINGLPCIMITPMGLLIAFILAQGDTAWSFLIWWGLIALSLVASDMSHHFLSSGENRQSAPTANEAVES